MFPSHDPIDLAIERTIDERQEFQLEQLINIEHPGTCETAVVEANQNLLKIKDKSSNNEIEFSVDEEGYVE